jgi:hypothetical protein
MKRIDLPKVDLGRTSSKIALPDLGLVRRPATAAASADLEEASTKALDQLQSDFQKRAKEEERRYADATDSEYWVAFCFQTREQKEEFLQKLGLLDLGDKYLDGRAVAEKLGVTLVSREPKWSNGKKNSRLTELT